MPTCPRRPPDAAADVPSSEQTRHVSVGVDTGGTFTDLVVGDGAGTEAGRVVKLPSTPAATADAVADAVREAMSGSGADRPDLLAHGTTVATNALLERRLGRVALVATRGFADVIEIARQARPSLYDPHVDRPPALVPRALRFEVGGRLDAQGRELEAFDGVVPELPCDERGRGRRLPAALRPERRARASRGALGRRCTRGATGRRGLLTRGVARVPRVRAHGDDGRRRRVATGVRRRTWAGSRRPRERGAGDDVGRWPRARSSTRPNTRPRCCCRDRPPGCGAAAAVAEACGCAERGQLRHGWHQHRRLPRARRRARAGAVAAWWRGFPIRLPALAVHTIGAGGGSIARLDRGGALVVGPGERGCRSRARRATGAAATAPTVTDADLRARAHPRRCAASRARRARCRRRRPGARPCGSDGRGRGRGRRRRDGTRGARGDRGAGHRPA